MHNVCMCTVMCNVVSVEKKQLLRVKVLLYILEYMFYMQYLCSTLLRVQLIVLETLLAHNSQLIFER
jgi:hypothetical protein